MRTVYLLFGLLIFGSHAFAGEQVYFKIAINGNTYSTFLNDSVGIEKPTASYLASKMREMQFRPSDVDKAYYNISGVYQLRFAGRNVTQYDIRPKSGDRFRQVIMVDNSDGDVVHKDVYDVSGRLVFSFTSIDPIGHEEKPSVQEAPAMSPPRKTPCLKGFCVVGARMLRDGTKHIMLSDGLNKFSIFAKKLSLDVPPSKRIMYGNYVMRKKVGDNLFTVVGTVPFNEMEYMIDNYSSLEGK